MWLFIIEDKKLHQEEQELENDDICYLNSKVAKNSCLILPDFQRFLNIFATSALPAEQVHTKILGYAIVVKRSFAGNAILGRC